MISEELLAENERLRAALQHLLNADRIRPEDCAECANAQKLAYPNAALREDE